MKNPVVTSKRFCILSGCSGILGVVLLIISFNINPGPQPNATLNQLIEFGNQYYAAIFMGSLASGSRSGAYCFIRFFIGQNCRGH